MLEQAINTRKVVTFTYDGLARIVEPHALGVTSKQKAVLRGFQPDGETQRGLGWKLFSVDKIVDLVVTNDNFPAARDGYKKGDRQMSVIHAEL